MAAGTPSTRAREMLQRVGAAAPPPLILALQAALRPRSPRRQFYGLPENGAKRLKHGTLRQGSIFDLRLGSPGAGPARVVEQEESPLRGSA